MAFISSPLDRADHLRRAPERLIALQHHPMARHLSITGDQVAYDDGQLVNAAPAEAGTIFLGLAPDGAPWFANSATADAPLIGLRALMLSGELDSDSIAILAQARSLVHWHEQHGFCAACGAKTAMQDAGYRRHCARCASDHFPRTDPVVIMVVTRADRMLLGRQSSWPPGMYSALAGFMEPGETIEQAARREVKEEAGISVGTVRYHASQPWPFPASLMIGLIGEALSEEITIDGNELEDARWFTFTEARQMVQGEHPQGLTAPKPYAIAHELVRAVLE